ncbi:hypothetical protein [Terasakiella sp. SH-1]|uniref:hypothetical protein n=1 Tax=Terasakiella sp. SH-1 TaxID=2560057 RepID=UPI0010740963|nr:hypothetical protein [Terasakiella sp. SH-1]
MSMRVYIATTEGPVCIQRISREDPDVRSVVCLNGTAKALPISRAYDSFVKEPTGVVQRSYAHPSYRMDVDRVITDGNSWQLGAFVAHALENEEELAGPEDEIDTVLWCTGELDRDLKVRPVDHIKEKLLASQALFQQLREQNIRVFCFLPSGAGLVPEDEFLEELGVDGDLLHLESLIDVHRIIQRFELPPPLPETEEDEDEGDDDEVIDLYKPDPNAPPPLKDNRLGKLIALGLCLVALGVGLYMQFEDNIIALRAGSLKIGISELRANTDKGCQSPDTIPLQRDGSSFPSSSLNGLCALEITVNNMGAPAYMWAFAQRLEDGHFLLADREGLLEADMQKGLIGWRMILPKNLSKTIDYRIVALASSSPLGDAVNRMLRSSFGEEKPNWEKMKVQLVEEKITVTSMVHSLVR